MQIVSRMSRSGRALLLAMAIASIAACGQQRPEGTSAPPAQKSAASYKEFGAYQLHFNALRGDSLAPEVARAYGIERSKNRVMLNVTVLRKDGGETKPVEAAVDVKAYNLNGQLKNMSMRRVNEGSAIYYIGETGISGSEILVFDIKATPVNDTAVLEASLRREFFSD